MFPSADVVTRTWAESRFTLIQAQTPSESSVSHMEGSSVEVESGFFSGYSDGLWAGRLEFDSQIFLFSIASRPAVGLAQPPNQRVLGDIFPAAKVAGA
jgi:hypothetical protein